MRYLVLSDVHANLEALDAVIAAARANGYDAVLVLGDLVGYGPDPNTVIDRVRDLSPVAVVRGNHDKVAAGLEDAGAFNRVARHAAEWTFDLLDADHREYLAALPPGPLLVDETIEICHGTPLDEDEYVASDLDAVRAINQAIRPVCLFGHTHIPLAARLTDHDFDLVPVRGTESGTSVPFEPNTKYLLNPGSVGQPRDGDPRAAYALVDGRTATWFRVPYDIAGAYAKIIAAGLPRPLAERLRIGR